MGAYSYSMLSRLGLTVGDWDDWHAPSRYGHGHHKRRERGSSEYIPSMLDPDDPGVAGLPVGEYTVRPPPIAMHIGAWYRDEHGNRCREIMSEETFADRNY